MSAQTLQNSFGSAVYALPLLKGAPKLLNNNKKEDEE